MFRTCAHQWMTTFVAGKTRARCVRCGDVKTWTFVYHNKTPQLKVVA